jgi:hypothetical protein
MLSRSRSIILATVIGFASLTAVADAHRIDPSAAFYVAAAAPDVRSDCGRAGDWACKAYPWGVRFAPIAKGDHSWEILVGYRECRESYFSSGCAGGIQGDITRFCHTHILITHYTRWPKGAKHC